MLDFLRTFVGRALSATMRRCCFVSVWTIDALACCADVAPHAINYQDNVRPIFQEHCFACHSQDEQKGKLALDSYQSVMSGGASGAVVVDGDPESSRLWKLVSHADAPHMPPDQDKLADDELEMVHEWIANGLGEHANSERKPREPLPPYTPNLHNRPSGVPAMPLNVTLRPLASTHLPNAVDVVALSPWAPLAAIGGLRQISLYHTDSGELLGVLHYPEGKPFAARFSRDGSLLVVGGGRSGAHGNTAIYDVRSGARLAALGEEIDAVTAVDISPDQRLVALGGPKKVVRVYQVADGTLAYEIKRHADWIMALEFSPDGALLASADRGGTIAFVEAQRGNDRLSIQAHREAVTSLSWRADSAQLASASEDDTIRLWSSEGVQKKSWTAHAGGVLDVAFHLDGRIASCGRDARAKVWQIDGRPLCTVAELSDAGLAIGWTHDGQRIVVGDWKGRSQLLDVESGAQVALLPPNPSADDASKLPESEPKQ